MLKDVVELDFIDTRQAMDMLFKAGVVSCIKSKPGQGKTSLVQQYADSQGPDFGLFEINCSLANQPDFMGWFYRCQEVHADFDGNDITIETGKYTFPYFGFDKRTRRPWFQFKRGVLVYEEYGQCDPDLKKALGQTMLEWRVGQHPIPRGFHQVALSNYEGGRDAVGRDFDFLINRRGELHMKNTLDNWLIYAHENSFTNMVMAFASVPLHKVFDGDTPKDQGPWLTPRSTEMLDKFIRVVIDCKADFADPLVRVTAAGLVGGGAAHQFIAFANLQNKIPTIAQIVKDPEGTRVPEKTDQCMFLIFNMADKAEKSNISKLVTYMKRLPSDMAVAFYKNALLRDKSLMSCREFGDWAMENKTLLAVVNSRTI